MALFNSTQILDSIIVTSEDIKQRVLVRIAAQKKLDAPVTDRQASFLFNRILRNGDIGRNVGNFLVSKSLISMAFEPIEDYSSNLPTEVTKDPCWLALPFLFKKEHGYQFHWLRNHGSGFRFMI